MSIPNHRERQFMQYLRAGGWISASSLPSSPKTIAKLLQKGWIEVEQGEADEVLYRMTELGLTAKKATVPISQ